LCTTWRFGQDNLDVLVETSKRGIIDDIAIAPQAGATAPAHLAGALVQVLAEGLACLAVVNMIRPGCPMSFALWPFAVDLRSGGFSGGCAEVAVMMATLACMENEYFYPDQADRNRVSVWREDGAKDMLERAREEVARILAEPTELPFSAEIDRRIRERFPIHLPATG
jgi:trimethylamine:corrinoid methyltransferase-like protein